MGIVDLLSAGPVLGLSGRRFLIMKVDFSEARQYQTFLTKEALNHSIKNWRYDHKHKIPESWNNILDLLASHALKIIGVAFPAIDYIEKKAGVSERTVFRALKGLEKLQIIKRIPRFDENGGQIPSFYTILPYISEKLAGKNKVTPPCDTGDMAPGGETSNTDNQRDEPTFSDTETLSSDSTISDRYKKRINVQDVSNSLDTDEKLDYTFVPKYIPLEFTMLVKRYFDDAHRIKKFWSLIVAGFRRYKMEIDIELAIEAFKDTVFAKKDTRREIRTSFDRYFWGVLEKKIADIYDYELRIEEYNRKYGFSSENNYDPSMLEKIWSRYETDNENVMDEVEDEELELPKRESNEQENKQEEVDQSNHDFHGEADPEVEKRIRAKIDRMHQRLSQRTQAEVNKG